MGDNITRWSRRTSRPVQIDPTSPSSEKPSPRPWYRRREHANHASVLIEQTKQFADDIRSQVAEKSRELAEMNERGGSIGSTLAISTSVLRGAALNISTTSWDGLPRVSFRPMSFGTTVLGLGS